MIANRDALGGSSAREVALDCVEAGIAAAHPERVIGERVRRDGSRLDVDGAGVDLDEYGSVLVLGGGKPAGRIAAALEDVLAGDGSDRGSSHDGPSSGPGSPASGSDDSGCLATLDGVVVTTEPVETRAVEVIEASHPVPDERGLAGARRMLDRAAAADEDALVLAVVGGGGSALLPASVEGVSLDDLRATTRALVESGAPIAEVNAVRKHVSALKGGRLARAAAPATVVGLVFSDVVGDDPAVVASGPTAPDATTFDDARGVLDRYRVDVPSSVCEHLARGARGEVPETPGPDDPAFDRVENHVLADASTALDAARAAAEERGYAATVLSGRVRGEAREAAKTHAAVAEEVRATGNPLSPPAVLLSGGETTVTVRGDGRGGPNQEFALSAALELRDDAVVVSIDTDGIDGASDAAGALVDATTVDAPEAARAALADNDAGTYLDARDALVVTGPTGTNVDDLRAVVVD